MFKKILCATNLNDTSKFAIKKAVQLAHQYDSKIILLNVHEEFMSKEEMGMLRVSIDTMKSEFKKTALKAKKEMRKEIESLHAEDIQVEYILKDGKINKVICEEAKNVRADLIVMGASENRLISHFISKRIPSYVIKHSNIPVLVVPMKK